MADEQPEAPQPQPQSAFESLPLAKTAGNDALEGMYRVYTDEKNYISIQANSALNALEQSGLQSAIRIERETLHKNNLLKPKFTDGKTLAAVSKNGDGMAGAPVDQAEVEKILNSNG
jgi:hypothetical protein